MRRHAGVAGAGMGAGQAGAVGGLKPPHLKSPAKPTGGVSLSACTREANALDNEEARLAGRHCVLSRCMRQIPSGFLGTTAC